MAKKLKQVILKHVANDFKEDIIGDIKLLQGVVRTDAFVNLEIPNNANAREFDENTKNVKNMITTLRTNPQGFVLNNNGIRIIASQVQRNTDGSYTLYIDENEGVVNGNHTANVLRRHGIERAYVPVFIQIGNFTKEKLSEMSTSLNSHKLLDERSRQDKLEKHEWIKKLLDENYSIQYHSGGAGELNVDDVLRRAYIFYPDDKGLFHERAGTYRVVSKGIFHNLNKSEKLQRTQFVLKDIMELYDWIQKDEQLIKMLNKPTLNKFIDKEGMVQQGLILHTMSLAKAFMYAPNKYATWHKGLTLPQVKTLLRRNYRHVVDILKAKKYTTLTHYDVLGDINIFSDFEGLRKSMQIDFLTAMQQKREA